MGDVKICIKSPPKGKITPEIQGNFQFPQVSAPQVPVPQVPVPQQTNLSQPNEAVQSQTDAAAEALDNNHVIIKSPIIGTFYRKPSPDKDPFVNVGDRVDEGSVVGIVEAMKLFNEIESDISGTIIKVLVDDMSPVEYDQPLFLVDKN